MRHSKIHETVLYTDPGNGKNSESQLYFHPASARPFMTRKQALQLWMNKIVSPNKEEFPKAYDTGVVMLRYDGKTPCS